MIRSTGGDIADDTAASVIELSGAIKWFDVSKGYGFIVPDNGLPDILLHVTCLRRDGFQTAYEGARVVAEVLQRPKGLQCFRILSMDDSTAIHPSTMPPARTHVTVTPTSGLERAQVKWFNRLRGFGFLTRGEGTPDIFVHMETLRRFGLTELRPGQTVLVRFGPGPKGLMAAEVQAGWRPARPSLPLIHPLRSKILPDLNGLPPSCAAPQAGRGFVVFLPQLAYLLRAAAPPAIRGAAFLRGAPLQERR